jgi:hypothetical protein
MKRASMDNHLYHHGTGINVNELASTVNKGIITIPK